MGVGEDHGGGDGGGVVGAEGARGVAGTLAGGAVGTAVGGVVPCGGTFHARTASLAAGARFFRNRPWAVGQRGCCALVAPLLRPAPAALAATPTALRGMATTFGGSRVLAIGTPTHSPPSSIPPSSPRLSSASGSAAALAIQDWLEAIKDGYGKFAPAFELLGIEDVADAANIDEPILAELEAVLLKDCHAKKMHLQNIRIALGQLRGAGNGVAASHLQAHTPPRSPIVASPPRTPPVTLLDASPPRPSTNGRSHPHGAQSASRSPVWSPVREPPPLRASVAAAAAEVLAQREQQKDMYRQYQQQKQQQKQQQQRRGPPSQPHGVARASGQLPPRKALAHTPPRAPSPIMTPRRAATSPSPRQPPTPAAEVTASRGASPRSGASPRTPPAGAPPFMAERSNSFESPASYRHRAHAAARARRHLLPTATAPKATPPPPPAAPPKAGAGAVSARAADNERHGGSGSEAQAPSAEPLSHQPSGLGALVQGIWETLGGAPSGAPASAAAASAPAAEAPAAATAAVPQVAGATSTDATMMPASVRFDRSDASLSGQHADGASGSSVAPVKRPLPRSDSGLARAAQFEEYQRAMKHAADSAAAQATAAASAAYKQLAATRLASDPTGSSGLWAQLAKGIETEAELSAFFTRRQTATGPNVKRLGIASAVKVVNNAALRAFVSASSFHINALQAHKSSDSFLFHGCPEASATNIQADGLKMSFAANGMLGRGLYGAPDPRKSEQFCKHSVNGKFMFVCRACLRECERAPCAR